MTGVYLGVTLRGGEIELALSQGVTTFTHNLDRRDGLRLPIRAAINLRIEHLQLSSLFTFLTWFFFLLTKVKGYFNAGECPRPLNEPMVLLGRKLIKWQRHRKRKLLPGTIAGVCSHVYLVPSLVCVAMF